MRRWIPGILILSLTACMHSAAPITPVRTATPTIVTAPLGTQPARTPLPYADPHSGDGHSHCHPSAHPHADRDPSAHPPPFRSSALLRIPEAPAASGGFSDRGELDRGVPPPP
jgi:hypothetical protein